MQGLKNAFGEKILQSHAGHFLNLELRFALAVVRADQPLLEVPNSAIGKWDG